jgi:hypothetical protein
MNTTPLSFKLGNNITNATNVEGALYLEKSNNDFKLYFGGENSILPLYNPVTITN